MAHARVTRELLLPQPPDPLLHAAAGLVAELARAGHQAVFAGGVVRDLLLGRPPHDVDIATSAKPEEVSRVFPDARFIGRAFGVSQVLRDGVPFQVATFREDAAYLDGRHPSAVSFTDAEHDAQRRDFTVNGLFYDPLTRKIMDYVGGLEDLDRRVIRAIGDADRRFSEDYLRLLRACRFASTLGFTIDPGTLDAIRRGAARIRDVSAERIQEELTRLLTQSPKAGQGLLLLREAGLLQIILPEVDAMAGVEQPPEHHPEGDVLTHTVLMLDLMENADPVLAYSVLLHDVGKPPTAELTVSAQGGQRIRFDQHAKVGADLAVAILERLRSSNDLVKAVAACVRYHMQFIDVQQMRPATLRRMMGRPTFPTELELHRIDCLGSHKDLSNHAFLVDAVKKLRDEKPMPRAWITGRDIMDLGVPEGPEVGRWHHAAYEAQLEGRWPTRDELLRWLSAEIKAARHRGA